MITKLIDNFSGILSRDNINDMNSGLVKYPTSFGYDPFSNISNLTWLEAPTQIDSGGSVITDLIMAAKPRLENGITYVYAIGHTGRLYKIQVNQPSGFNPNLDNPTLLTTLIINSPTFKFGSSIEFFGVGTEKLYIGHDLGITTVNFDGTSEAFVGVLGSYTANVPRPSVIFQGVYYFGNGQNIGAIDSTLIVTTYAKLNPGLDIGTYIRDLDLTPNGTYMEIIQSYLNSPDLTSSVQDTTSLSSADSFIVLWNGTDTAATSRTSYSGYTINANTAFGPFTYALGYDLGGAAIYSSGKKVISLPNSISPNSQALFSTGNLLGLANPETTSTNFLTASIMLLGQYDEEMPKGGWYRMLRKSASGTETDVIQVPVCLTVSNLFYGSSSAGYAGNQVGSAKLYFSTLETSSAPTAKYKFYKFTTVPTGTGTAIGGVYETQQETSIKLFRNVLKKKLTVKEIRLYAVPLVTGNSFQIDIIGTSGNPISGGTFTFTVGTNLSAGTDFAMYNPAIAPQHSIGIRITNLGPVNWVGEKMEIDCDESGK